MSEQLKLSKCPFCGSRAVHWNHWVDGWWDACCHACDARTGRYDTQAAATAAWNRRAASGPAATGAGVPEPDWSQAPEWARWWAVDANGAANWYAHRPECEDDDSGMWWSDFQNEPDLPDMTGMDWRTTLRQRPQAREAAK